MKLSELISELIDMKLDGEPQYDDYRDRIAELESQIDAIVENAKV